MGVTVTISSNNVRRVSGNARYKGEVYSSRIGGCVPFAWAASACCAPILCFLLGSVAGPATRSDWHSPPPSWSLDKLVRVSLVCQSHLFPLSLCFPEPLGARLLSSLSTHTKCTPLCTPVHVSATHSQTSLRTAYRRTACRTIPICRMSVSPTHSPRPLPTDADAYVDVHDPLFVRLRPHSCRRHPEHLCAPRPSRTRAIHRQ